MFKKIALVVVVVLIAFLGFVSTKDGHFRYERSGVINAPAEKIWPYISNLKMGKQWSPFEQKDPNLKMTFSGNDGEVGSKSEFEGNSDVGSGSLEVLALVPNKQVDMKLTMTKPVHGENLVVYTLTPEAQGTRFSWVMSGDGGFVGKLMATLIDCEKMIGDEFTKGINNLKVLLESQP